MPTIEGNGTGRLRINRSADKRWPLKKPPPPYDQWFYDGPTLDFGHKPNPKKGKK